MDVLIIGGGVAGLAAAAALGGAGFGVELLERRPFAGGRASSYLHPGAEETIDNCQHVVLGCCTNLMDFYRRLGVAGKIHFHGGIAFRTPGGRESVISASLLPAPLHLAPSLFQFHALGWRDRLAISRGMLAVAGDLKNIPEDELDRQSFLAWLQAHGQTERAIDYFWGSVTVSALNEELGRVSALLGLKVFWLGFAAAWRGYRVGLPATGLSDLYSAPVPNVTTRFRSAVTAIEAASAIGGVTLADGSRRTARAYLFALPFEALNALLPGAAPDFEHSPITGIHLWFDRPVIHRPFIALLGRTIQWAFHRHDDPNYVQCVVSASRALLPMSQSDIVTLATAELLEFFPESREAVLVKSAVVKEVRATFSAAPGSNRLRPGNRTAWSNAWIAGDWTQTGWPATMEGAVRSGYRAAEMVAEHLGKPQSFVVADMPADGLARWIPL